MKSLNDLFREVILLNELDGNEQAALRFSDPDGPSGRSGWSFGICQFDTKHNDAALACLRECGFTGAEIAGVVAQNVNVKILAPKLNAQIVARYDEAQLSRCLYAAMNMVTSNGIMISDTGGILCIADYFNQYGGAGPAFIAYLQTKDGDMNITPPEVQEWKLNHTLYGKQHPADCTRRYQNILKVLKENV
jgi:hypothetical protein